MADPYRRYTAVPPPSSERGSDIPKSSFPGYLSSDNSTLTSFNPYSSTEVRGNFLQKDILPSHSEAYAIDDIAGFRSEPGVSGLTAGTSIRGYPSSFEDPSFLGHRRDVAAGMHPDVPYDRPSSIRRSDGPIHLDVPYDRPSSIRRSDGPIHPDAAYDGPSSIRRSDGPAAPVAESNVLFVDGLPTDCTRREIGHLFRPFIGFRELRVVHKEPRRRGDKAMVLCFVEFTDAKCALTALEALQGYKFDDRKTDSPFIKIHFAHFPFRLPSDRDDQRVGSLR